MSWRHLAACKGMNPDMWFPDEGAGARTDWEPARAICDKCQVKGACLAEAMASEGRASGAERDGMWGGLTPTERRKLVRKTRKRRVA